MKRKVCGFAVCLLGVTACGTTGPATKETRATKKAEVPASRPTAVAPGDCQRWAGQLEAAIKRADGRALDHLRALVRTYQRLQKSGASSGARSRCGALVASTLGGHAVRWHREGARTSDRSALELAATSYRMYRSTFPGAADIYDMTFYHAELLFKLERWDEAAWTYAGVLRMKPKGKHAPTASYARLMACKNLLSNEDATHVPLARRTGDHRTPQKITAARRRFLAAVSAHLKLAPTAPERVPLLYRQARIYYEVNRYAEGVKIFAEIVTKHPDHELAVYAANPAMRSDLRNLRNRGGGPPGCRGEAEGTAGTRGLRQKGRGAQAAGQRLCQMVR